VSGARIQALLEYDYPGLSVFSEEYTEVFKTHKPVPRSTNAIVASWQAVHNSTDGQFITSPGNSPTDAMSVGIGFVLAYLTNADAGKRAKYAASVEQAVDYIWTGIPRDSKGAISTRPATEPIQYWADELCELPLAARFFGSRWRRYAAALHGVLWRLLAQRLHDQGSFPADQTLPADPARPQASRPPPHRGRQLAGDEPVGDR
jgi:hypothetical protein